MRNSRLACFTPQRFADQFITGETAVLKIQAVLDEKRVQVGWSPDGALIVIHFLKFPGIERSGAWLKQSRGRALDRELPAAGGFPSSLIKPDVGISRILGTPNVPNTTASGQSAVSEDSCALRRTGQMAPKGRPAGLRGRSAPEQTYRKLPSRPRHP